MQKWFDKDQLITTRRMTSSPRIIIRLPNWLGDLVMSTAFVKAVRDAYPEAIIDLITKKGIDFLLDHFPAHNQRFVFDKNDFRGLRGAWQFGKQLSKNKYDIYFCMPDSLSSAVMARASGAEKIVGFKKEMRSFLLTHSYTKPVNKHRVEEYVNLLEQFVQNKILIPAVELKHDVLYREQRIVVNINSEASSRRLPKQKAISLINKLSRETTLQLWLVGSPKEQAWVDEIYQQLDNKTQVVNAAGKTNMLQLIEIFSSSQLVLTTDSGPAHVSNALGTPTIILFGAGNENNTAPYNAAHRRVIRLAQLPCEPCMKNVCKLYPEPACLLRLNENIIVKAVDELINANH